MKNKQTKKTTIFSMVASLLILTSFLESENVIIHGPILPPPITDGIIVDIK